MHDDYFITGALIGGGMGGALYAVNLTRRLDEIIPTNTAASRPASFALRPPIGLRPGGTDQGDYPGLRLSLY